MSTINVSVNGKIRLTNIQWEKLIIACWKKYNFVDVDFLVEKTGNSRNKVRQMVKMVKIATEKKGKIIPCKNLNMRKGPQKPEYRVARKIRAIQNYLPKGFGKYLVNNGQLYLDLAISYLQKEGWKFFDIGTGNYYQKR